ncbi:MAG: molybdopterin-dependent oxidoreductase, partial [Gallionella sp.]
SAETGKLLDAVQPSGQATAIARSLASGEQGAVLLGNFAQQHPQATQIAMLAGQIAMLADAKFGFLGEAANSVGACLAGAVPYAAGTAGMNAAEMLSAPRKAYVLLNTEPELDMHDPQQAMKAMYAADMVVAMSAFKHHATEYADVLLPIAPFTETSGTFVNTEGLAQSFRGAVRPLGEARPAWKVLRVLGNLLNVPGFDYDTSEAVRDEVLPKTDIATNMAGRLNNHIPAVEVQVQSGSNQGLQRVSDVPIYFADAIVRRAAALQKTRDAATPGVSVHSGELHRLGLSPGDTVKVSQGGASVNMTLQANDSLPLRTVRIAAGHPVTQQLGAMFGAITVERA